MSQQNPTPPVTPPPSDSESSVVSPGAYLDSFNDASDPDPIGVFVSGLAQKAQQKFDDVSQTTNRASAVFEKMASLVESLDPEQIKMIIEGANRLSVTGNTFADTVTKILDTIKNPAEWLKYVLPVLVAVGAYLVLKEQNPVLIPALKALCLAAATYFTVPYAQQLLAWFNHISGDVFHGPSDSYTIIGVIVDKLMEYSYGIQIDFKKIVTLLIVIPKAIDGVNRIWGLITTLWSEIKVRIYATLGWECRTGDLSVDRLSSEASDLVLQLKSDKLMYTQNVAMRVRDLVDAHSKMITKLAGENKGSLASYLKSSLEALKKAQVEIARKTGTGFGNRPEPAFGLLFGDPGQGKTVGLGEIEKALMRAISTQVEYEAYKENSRNGVFQVVPGMKHWEGVSNNCKIVKFDELWAEKEVAGMDHSQSLILQQLINTAPFNPPMAFEAKGMVSLEPDFVLGTTNVTSLSGVQTLQVVSALKRRIHFLMKVERGPEPFGDVIDLTNIRFIPHEVNTYGAFVSKGKPITAAEFVSLLLERRAVSRGHQKASFINANVQTDYLLGLTKDPKEYLKKLVAVQKDQGKEKVVDASQKKEIIDKAARHDGEDPQFPDEADVAWNALNTVPLRYLRSSDGPVRFITLAGESLETSMVFAAFVRFCRVTGISWSFEKFMSIFDHETYVGCLSLPKRPFEIWFSSFGGELLQERVDMEGFRSNLVSILSTIPQQIQKWVDLIVPQFVRTTDFLFAAGGVLLTTYFLSDHIRRLFYASTPVLQSDEEYQRKAQKTINRDRKYLFRMKHGQDEPDPSDYGYVAQMGDRVPEMVRNTWSAVVDNQYVLSTDQFEGRLGFGTFIKDKLLIMPCHFAMALNALIDEDPDKEIMVKFSNAKLEKLIPAKQLLLAGEGDDAREYFVTTVDLGRQHRDITMHFPNSSELSKFMVDMRNHMDLAIEIDGSSYVGLKSSFHHTAEVNYSALDGKMRKINSVLRVANLQFKAGDCGVLYYAMTGPAAGKIVGMHIGGNSVFKQGLGIFLTKQLIERWFKDITPGKIVHFNETRRVLIDDIRPVERVSYTNAHMQFSGNAPIVPYEKTNVNITKAGIEARLANYDKPVKRSFNIEHINDVTRLIGAKVLANLPRTAKRLSFHTTLFGEPGTYSGIDLSTSSGYPLRGTDLDKRFWLLEDGSPNIDLLNRVRDYVQEDFALYAEGVYPNHIFSIFPKDEKLPVFDVLEKNKVRTINGAPILHIIEQKMMFGDFAYLIEQNSLELNHLIGVNLNSNDGDDLARRLRQMNPTGEYCFGGDISKFEFSQDYSIQMSIFENIVLPCYADAPLEDNIIRRMIWDHSSQSTHLWDDKLYIVNGCRASGEFLTSVGNSLYVLTSIIYAYYKAFDFKKEALRTFFDNVYVVCLGDDNCGAITEAAHKFFDQVKIRDGLADLGLKYTSPDKDEITEPFIKFDDLVMLQCQPRYDTMLGRWVWKQNLKSILEIAQWTKKQNRRPDLNIWASNVIESLKKLCVHEEEVWNKYVPMFQRMVIGYEVDVPTWGYREMQAIVFHEEDLRIRYKTDYGNIRTVDFSGISISQFEAQSGNRTTPNDNQECVGLSFEITHHGFCVPLDTADEDKLRDLPYKIYFEGRLLTVLRLPEDKQLFWRLIKDGETWDLLDLFVLEHLTDEETGSIEYLGDMKDVNFDAQMGNRVLPQPELVVVNPEPQPEVDDCTICLEPLINGVYRSANCRHEFHVLCIDRWLTDHEPDCPLCKAHLFTGHQGMVRETLRRLPQLEQIVEDVVERNLWFRFVIMFWIALGSFSYYQLSMMVALLPRVPNLVEVSFQAPLYCYVIWVYWKNYFPIANEMAQRNGMDMRFVPLIQCAGMFIGLCIALLNPIAHYLLGWDIDHDVIVNAAFIVPKAVYLAFSVYVLL